MKEVGGWIIIVFCSICLGICLGLGMGALVIDKQTEPTEEGVKWFEYVDMNVIRHRETGVCYYATEDYITPLYNADGSLYVLGG